jgi:hypothetical protein
LPFIIQTISVHLGERELLVAGRERKNASRSHQRDSIHGGEGLVEV